MSSESPFREGHVRITTLLLKLLPDMDYKKDMSSPLWKLIIVNLGLRISATMTKRVNYKKTRAWKTKKNFPIIEKNVGLKGNVITNGKIFKQI